MCRSVPVLNSQSVRLPELPKKLVGSHSLSGLVSRSYLQDRFLSNDEKMIKIVDEYVQLKLSSIQSDLESCLSSNEYLKKILSYSSFSFDIREFKQTFQFKNIDLNDYHSQLPSLMFNRYQKYIEENFEVVLKNISDKYPDSYFSVDKDIVTCVLKDHNESVKLKVLNQFKSINWDEALRSTYKNGKPFFLSSVSSGDLNFIKALHDKNIFNQKPAHLPSLLSQSFSDATLLNCAVNCDHESNRVELLSTLFSIGSDKIHDIALYEFSSTELSSAIGAVSNSFESLYDKDYGSEKVDQDTQIIFDLVDYCHDNSISIDQESLKCHLKNATKYPQKIAKLMTLCNEDSTSFLNEFIIKLNDDFEGDQDKKKCFFETLISQCILHHVLLKITDQQAIDVLSNYLTPDHKESLSLLGSDSLESPMIHYKLTQDSGYLDQLDHLTLDSLKKEMSHLRFDDTCVKHFIKESTFITPEGLVNIKDCDEISLFEYIVDHRHDLMTDDVLRRSDSSNLLFRVMISESIKTSYEEKSEPISLASRLNSDLTLTEQRHLPINVISLENFKRLLQTKQFDYPEDAICLTYDDMNMIFKMSDLHQPTNTQEVSIQIQLTKEDLSKLHDFIKHASDHNITEKKLTSICINSCLDKGLFSMTLGRELLDEHYIYQNCLDVILINKLSKSH